jgi:predicted SprT family Zn-dependent metalloprotease
MPQRPVLQETLRNAREALKYYGLAGWRVELDRAKRRAGVCRFSKKTLGFSEHFILLNEHEEIEDTILHEIAHALEWERHQGKGHSSRWKAICREIGARPERCGSYKMPQGRFEYRCPVCGYGFFQHKRSTKNAACGHCCKSHNNGKYDARFKLSLKIHPLSQG